MTAQTNEVEKVSSEMLALLHRERAHRIVGNTAAEIALGLAGPHVLLLSAVVTNGERVNERRQAKQANNTARRNS